MRQRTWQLTPALILMLHLLWLRQSWWINHSTFFCPVTAFLTPSCVVSSATPPFFPRCQNMSAMSKACDRKTFHFIRNNYTEFKKRSHLHAAHNEIMRGGEWEPSMRQWLIIHRCPALRKELMVGFDLFLFSGSQWTSWEYCCGKITCHHCRKHNCICANLLQDVTNRRKQWQWWSSLPSLI